MKDLTAEADRLIQGILVPVKDLRVVRRTLASKFNVTDALPVLRSLTLVDSPTPRSARPVMLSKSSRVVISMTDSYPEHFVRKCVKETDAFQTSLPVESRNIVEIGTRITDVGIITERDMTTMRDWHAAMTTLEAMEDMTSWIRNSKFSRIPLREPFDNCKNVELDKCASRLDRVDLRTSLPTPFGRVEISHIVEFRRSQWLNDACISLAMAQIMTLKITLDNVVLKLGGIDPMFTRATDAARQATIIDSTKPFHSKNHNVLIPVFYKSHWCGVVSNVLSWKIVVRPNAGHEQLFVRRRLDKTTISRPGVQ